MKEHKTGEVFVPNGVPSITYIERSDSNVSRKLEKAILKPNFIVSLTGATKTGKTVLCRRKLSDDSYIWLEGAHIKSEKELWEFICRELNEPLSFSKKQGTQKSQGWQAQGSIEASNPLLGKLQSVFTRSGSKLSTEETERKYEINSVSQAISHLLEKDIKLVIDDFHYIPPNERTNIIRALRGPLSQGLKVILLSVSHRAFEALRAEDELTGRLINVDVPSWSEEDLSKIPTSGFDALNIKYKTSDIRSLSKEAVTSPLLMQSFCWEAAFSIGVEKTANPAAELSDANLEDIYKEVALETGSETYNTLEQGPQSRTKRESRLLKNGNSVDKYKLILYSASCMEDMQEISYDELRAKMTEICDEKIPQKHEITQGIEHLCRIAKEKFKGTKLDWNPEKRIFYISDPYLRFYMKWIVSKEAK